LAPKTQSLGLNFNKSSNQPRLPIVLTPKEIRVLLTQIYTHVIAHGANGVRSPLSSLLSD